MKRYSSRMGVGASSILLILVVVSLTLFAVLSLMQARADAALTDKTARSVGAYYDADARAQQMLAQIDGALSRGEDIALVEGVTMTAAGEYAFSVAASDGHTLGVALRVDGGAYTIISYRYVGSAAWSGENENTLWPGGGR